MANVLGTTLTALRQGALERIGQWYGYTTSGAGNAGGTTLVDATNLVNFANDKFNTWWCLLTSGTYSGQIRKVSDFVSSTGTITLSSAFGGQVASSVTYELCKWHPTQDIRQVLNVALKTIYPNLGRQMSVNLITGNWLPGSDEDWESTSVLRYVTKAGAGSTLAQESTIKKYGAYSAKLTRAGTDCYLETSDTEWKGLLDLGGQTVNLESWVYATVASRARLNILVNGVSVATSSYHSGGSTWELLTTGDYTVTDSPSSISFRRECNTGNTDVYFDNWRVIGPTLNSYVVPLNFSIESPKRIYYQTIGTEHGTSERPCDDSFEQYPYFELYDWNVAYNDTLGCWLLRASSLPPVGYNLRLAGMEYLSTVSAETDTVPVESAQAEMLYAKAAEVLFQKYEQYDKAKYWGSIFTDLAKIHSQPQVIPIRNFSTSKW